MVSGRRPAGVGCRREVVGFGFNDDGDARVTLSTSTVTSWVPFVKSDNHHEQLLNVRNYSCCSYTHLLLISVLDELPLQVTSSRIAGEGYKERVARWERSPDPISIERSDSHGISAQLQNAGTRNKRLRYSFGSRL